MVMLLAVSIRHGTLCDSKLLAPMRLMIDDDGSRVRTYLCVYMMYAYYTNSW